jgi:hypothetical protein
MRAGVEIFGVPKQDRENTSPSEDAFASSTALSSHTHLVNGYYASGAFNGENLSLAISDGASRQSYDSQYWAQVLADNFVENGTPAGPLISWLMIPQQRWQERIASVEPIDIFEKRQMLKGAWATLLGIEIRQYWYRIFAVGDSYAFHVRGSEIINVFPGVSAQSKAPLLLSSSDCVYNQKITQNIYERPGVFFNSGFYKSGDVILLMTDALAYFFLAKMQGRLKIPFIRFFQKVAMGNDARQKNLGQFCENWLCKKWLRDDDLTMLRVSFE